jgi:hypothetical protein
MPALEVFDLSYGRYDFNLEVDIPLLEAIATLNKLKSLVLEEVCLMKNPSMTDPRSGHFQRFLELIAPKLARLKLELFRMNGTLINELHLKKLRSISSMSWKFVSES